MSVAKRQHADVVSAVIERLETMTRAEWQQRLDRVAERFNGGASSADNYDSGDANVSKSLRVREKPTSIK